jgi:D-alanine-D-alanine ligase
MQEAANAIATARVKHDLEYQEKWGITEGPAKDLPPAVVVALPNICKRIYRTIELDGYARLDFRLTEGGELYFLEANPNPEIAEKEEFARSAKHAGVSYSDLLQRICRLGIQRTGVVAE